MTKNKTKMMHYCQQDYLLRDVLLPAAVFSALAQNVLLEILALVMTHTMFTDGNEVFKACDAENHKGPGASRESYVGFDIILKSWSGFKAASGYDSVITLDEEKTDNGW